MTPRKYSVFQIVLILRENDHGSRHIMQVLAALQYATDEVRLNGGGGYYHGRVEPKGESVVTFIMQKNDKASGNLNYCTEDDRSRAVRILTEHPNVARFEVGPLVSDMRSPADHEREETALIARLLSRVS